MEMSDRTQASCDRLFEYLRSILYDKEIQPLNPEELDVPFQKLARGLQFLEGAVTEMKTYSAAVSKGDLSAPAPGKDNPLCENLKNISADLKHLTWQAKQVAKGDYSQHVSFLGEFSDAFNIMIDQLREREQEMQEETRREKEHAEMAQRYNLLLLNLIAHNQESVLVTNAANSSILYDGANRLSAEAREKMRLTFRRKLASGELTPFSTESVSNMLWEIGLDGCFYRITTVAVEWEGVPAYAHIMLDVTKDRMKQEKLEQAAYTDQLTQVGNRSYFEHHIQQLLQQDTQLLLCYCDMDGLKQINDTYGHNEGDFYLRTFAQTVKRYIREKDGFARVGGDEFCVVLKNCPKDRGVEKLRLIQQEFSKAAPEKPYEKGFSFGIIEVPQGHPPETLERVLQQADMEMYRQKRERKKERQ